MEFGFLFKVNPHSKQNFKKLVKCPLLEIKQLILKKPSQRKTDIELIFNTYIRKSAIKENCSSKPYEEKQLSARN